MKGMKKSLTLAAVFLLALAGQVFAQADPGFDPGGDHGNDPTFNRPIKWLQPPDYPMGFDVLSNDLVGMVAADDFFCKGGPVTDIHWWGSYDMNEYVRPQAFWVGFWTDIPKSSQQPFSQPGVLLKSYIFNFDVTHETQEEIQQRTQHWGYHYAVDIAQDPFLQEEGNVYWLSIQALGSHTWGWKTSFVNWNDDQVVALPPAAGPVPPGTPWFPFWDPINDPETGDLAFALTTPEPASMLLLGAGLLGVGGIKRKKFKG